MKPSRVDVTIEQLVLHGFSNADRLTIGASLQAELGRLIARAGLPDELQADRQIGSLSAGTLSHDPLASPATIGAGIARSVFDGLSAGEVRP